MGAGQVILIAHKEDCKLVIVGPSYKRQIDSFIVQDIARPCTCGGVKVELIQGEPHSPGNFKAVVRMVD